MQVGDIARIAHEVNRAYCAAIGDESQPPWDAAPDWQRQSAISGIEFHLRYPAASPNASHVNWLEDKRRAGWVYGPRKDPDANPPTHPCMVPFEALPVEQRAKDHLFRAVAHTLIPYLEDEMAPRAEPTPEQNSVMDPLLEALLPLLKGGQVRAEPGPALSVPLIRLPIAFYNRLTDKYASYCQSQGELL
jgi:hypothetical protein